MNFAACGYTVHNNNIIITSLWQAKWHNYAYNATELLHTSGCFDWSMYLFTYLLTYLLSHAVEHIGPLSIQPCLLLPHLFCWFFLISEDRRPLMTTQRISTLFSPIANLIHSGINKPVQSLTSSDQSLFGLPRYLIPLMWPCRISVERFSALTTYGTSKIYGTVHRVLPRNRPSSVRQAADDHRRTINIGLHRFDGTLWLAAIKLQYYADEGCKTCASPAGRDFF